jgi:ABC-type antimicrobial peptide transport system permease subunit
VAGVYQMPPKNATNQFDLVFHFDLIIDNFPDINKWTYGGPDTYIVLAENTNLPAFKKKLSTYLQEKSEEDYQSLFIRPYSDKYLYGKYENGQQAGGRIDYVWLFSIIALFVLIIACINFMNLSSAKATRRFKEVGVKKAIGAERRHLISQYLSESLLLASLSLVLALIMVHLLLPQFNLLTGKVLDFSIKKEMLVFLFGITIFTGLLAGSYPAFYLSGFEAIEVLKGKINRSIGDVWIRKGLVVFQFAISVILIVSVLVIYKQIQFIQNKNLGFDKEQIIHFKREGRLNQDLNVFLSEIKKLSGVRQAAGIRSDLINNQSSTIGLRWQGLTEGNEFAFKYLMVDYDLLETIGVEVAEGRLFSNKFGDENSKIIFNETAIKAMGIDNPIGKTVRQWGKDKQIIGVVKDFHFESLYEPVKPCFIALDDKPRTVMVKLDGNKMQTTIAELAKVYKEFNEGLPFDYQFLDSDYAALYASETRVASLSKYFAVLAILISCLGLFGLVSFSAQRREKEIGIRKVLGASTLGIIKMLSADFTKMVLVAIIIALPFSYFIAHNWLDNFAFKIELKAWFFLIAGFGALVIAWITVGSQAIKAANLNPIDTLKTE